MTAFFDPILSRLVVSQPTTSANLAAVITNETGSGALVFANTPTLITPVLGEATGTSLTLTAANDTTIGSELVTTTADRDMSGANNWSGSNWTVAGGVFTHTAGADNATLAGYGATIGVYYQVAMDVVTTTSGTLTIKYGNAAAAAIGQVTGTLTAYTVVLLATTTDGLILAPNAAWAGTIDNVSIKPFTPAATILSGLSAAGTLYAEIRLPGVNSLCFGRSSGKFSTGSNAVGFGVDTLRDNTTGTFNVAFGSFTLCANTTGQRNSALGMNVAPSNTIGSYNSAFGHPDIKMVLP